MAKSIMIQGTMSNAGKSLLTAALCRIFAEDGYSVAPFKSQNMALNSYVTKDGLEIGRAQAMQAEAAGVAPTAAMNPILLKPDSDTSSQVIVNGKPVGNMTAQEYYRKKKDFVPVVTEAYKSLASTHDIIVIEGAGSPVELNLNSHDIVNMGIAKMAKSPVLLVGDIDRGGVFAQLLGTLSLLEPKEQNMVKALVVNKFRGDKEFFKDGVDILKKRSGKPVAGVIPYIKCDIDDEDSLSEKLNKKDRQIIDIAVIRLPRISNFTDFEVFSQYEGVGVRYVTSCEELKKPDMIILPGTKSTIADLRFLRECGLEARIKQLSLDGTPIIGICGGYQMLGQRVSDPYNAEGGGKEIGMGLLPTSTVFYNKKTTSRVRGKINDEMFGFFSCLADLEFEGYEIHLGSTEIYGRYLSIMDLGNKEGSFTENVMGTYVHGIFDNDEICERLVKALYKRKGLEYTAGSTIPRAEYKEKQYTILANAVRENLDMELIYKIIEEGI